MAGSGPGAGMSRLAEQAVHHLADRAVAAVYDDDRRPLVGCAPGQLAGVAPVVCVQNLKMHSTLERVSQQVTPGRRCRGGIGIHDEDRTHGA